MRTIASGALGVAATAAVVACGDGFGPRREITLNFCGLTPAVAIQADDGRWVSVGSGSSVTFLAPSRLAMAIAYPVSNILVLYYATADEAIKQYSCAQDAGAGNNKTVNVSVRGLGANEFGMIATPGNLHMHVPADFPLCCLPAEPVDIVAWKQYEPATGLPSVPRMIIRRGQNPVDNTTLPVFDFASAEAFAPVARTLTLAAAPTGTPIFAQTDFFTASGISMMVSADSTSGTSLVHHAVPVDKLAADDMHVVRFGADFRDVTLFFHASADRTLTFGLPMIRPTLTSVDGRLQVDLPVQPDYDKLFSMWLYDDDNNTISIVASSAYLDGAANWSFRVPNLSHIPEFGTLGTVSGGLVYSAFVSSMPLAFRITDARDGDVFRTASVLGGRQDALVRP